MKGKSEIRFLADGTVGKLAKWLRIFGFDTVYESDCRNGWVADRNRIRLTRSKQARKADHEHPHVVIVSDHYREQLRQVIRDVGIVPEDLKPFSRCIRCNEPTCEIGKEDVFGSIPDYIWQTHDAFWTCRRCNRVYWPGSHMSVTRERIQRLFGERK